MLGTFRLGAGLTCGIGKLPQSDLVGWSKAEAEVVLIFGWGTDTAIKQLNEWTVAICRYRYFSIFFVFSVVVNKQWFLQGRDRAHDTEVTRDQLESMHGADAVPKPTFWRSWSLLAVPGGFVALSIVVAIVSGVAGLFGFEGETVASAEPVAEVAAADEPDSPAVDESTGSTDNGEAGEVSSDEADADEDAEANTLQSSAADAETSSDDSDPGEGVAAAPGALGVVADAAALQGVEGIYSNVVVKVIEVRTSMVPIQSFDPLNPDDQSAAGDDQYVYVTLDFENLDPGDWFDFPVEFIRLETPELTVAAEFDFQVNSTKRVEARAAVTYTYGFKLDGPIDLADLAVSISDDTVPLVLPLGSPSEPSPYPLEVAEPAPFSYLDGAFQTESCGQRNQITLDEVIVDLQEPVEWQANVFGSRKRSATGNRQLIIKGFGERFEDPACTNDQSDVVDAHFRLLVDGRPGEPVGGELLNSRGLTGDVSEFELMWDVPVGASEIVLELTGSAGDQVTVPIDVGVMPAVLGE